MGATNHVERIYTVKGENLTAYGLRTEAREAFQAEFPDKKIKYGLTDARMYGPNERMVGITSVEAELSEGDKLVVGSIMVCGWGYDQTNIDYYQVVNRTPKTVNLVKIGMRQADDGRNVVPVIPSDDEGYDVDTFRRKVKVYNGDEYVTLNSYMHGSLWSGTPNYDTIAAGDAGH